MTCKELANESKVTKEIINDFEITVKEFILESSATYNISYTVVKLDDDIKKTKTSYTGQLNSKMSPIEIYHALTSEKRFYLDDKLLRSYTIFGSIKNSDEFNKEVLASKLNLPTERISVKIHKNKIYRHEVIQN